MDRRRGRGHGRPRRQLDEGVAQSAADHHDARNAPEVAASAPQSEAQPMSQLDIMMRFTQAVERIEALLTGRQREFHQLLLSPFLHRSQRWQLHQGMLQL